jgi:hypothetical protein
MDVEYHKLFYNLPHDQRLLMILMKSFKKDLEECKNKNSEFYISKFYTEHINLLSKSINSNNNIEVIKKNIPNTTNNTTNNIIKVNNDIVDIKPTTHTTLNNTNTTNNIIEDIKPNTTNNIEVNDIEVNNIKVVNDIEINNIEVNDIEINNNIEVNDIGVNDIEINNIEVVNDKKDNNNIEVVNDKKDNNISINNIEDIINELDKKMGKWEVSSSDNDSD